MYFLLAFFLTIGVSYLMGTKKSKAFGKKVFKNFGWITLISMFIGIMFPEDGFIYNQMIEFCGSFILILPYWIPWKIKNKKKEKEKETESKIIMTDEKIIEEKLENSAQGRSKIIEKFNEKYSLNLTAQQIESIISGSFQDVKWAKEILEMDKKYTSISEWYAGETSWLRAYLKVFNVQNVSSDFVLQKEICLNNFNEIFSSVDASDFSSIDECVEKINNTFFTNFDDATYMIAYRFLQENGMKYKLPSMGIVRAKNEIDDLAKKYDSSEPVENKETRLSN